MKVFLHENLVLSSQDKEVQMQDPSVEWNQIMWYVCMTAMSKVHVLDVKTISQLVNEVLDSEYFSEEEKGKFWVDIILHNFMRPFHCSRKEEEQYYWNLFNEQIGSGKVDQVIRYWILYLENLTHKELKVKTHNDSVAKQSLVKGIYIIRVVVQYLKGKTYSDFIELVCEYLSKTKYFTFTLLKNMLFRYLSQRTIWDILKQSLSFLSSKKDRDIEFVLKIACLWANVRNQLRQNSSNVNNLTINTIQKDIIMLLDTVIENEYMNLETKVVKIINVLSNGYQIELTREEQFQIAHKIADSVKAGKLEAWVTYDAATWIRTIELVHLQHDLISATYESLSVDKVPDVDGSPYKSWVKVLKKYIEIIQKFHDLMTYQKESLSVHVPEIILSLSKVKISIRRLRYSIGKQLSTLEYILELLIVSFRWYLGKVSKEIWIGCFERNPSVLKKHSAAKVKFFSLFEENKVCETKLHEFIKQVYYIPI